MVRMDTNLTMEFLGLGLGLSLAIIIFIDMNQLVLTLKQPNLVFL